MGQSKIELVDNFKHHCDKNWKKFRGILFDRRLRKNSLRITDRITNQYFLKNLLVYQESKN